MNHDASALTAILIDTYKAVATCPCGERFVEYRRDPVEARRAAERARTAHLVSKGAAS